MFAACARSLLLKVGNATPKWTILRGVQTQPKVIPKSMHAFASVNMPMKLTNGDTKADLIVPGYCYDDIDRAGSIAISRVARKDEAAHLRMYYDPDGSILSQLQDSTLAFMIASQYSFTPNFYSPDHYSMPLHYNIQVSAGNTSMTVHSQATSLKTESMLHESSVKYVFVDPKTHKPTTLPDWFMERIAPFNSAPQLQRFSLKPKPENALVVSDLITHSDIDRYGHVGNGFYLRFSHDAGSVLARQGKLTKLTDDLAYWSVKNVRCLYLGETRAGDEIQTHVWEDTENPCVLNFLSEVRGRPVFQCEMEFDCNSH